MEEKVAVNINVCGRSVTGSEQLRTSVHDLVHLVQVRQPCDNCERDLAENRLRDGANLLVDVVEGPAGVTSAGVSQVNTPMTG